MENVLYTVLYRTFFEKDSILQKKGYKLDNITIAEPFLVLYRTVHNTFSFNLKNNFTRERTL